MVVSSLSNDAWWGKEIDQNMSNASHIKLLLLLLIDREAHYLLLKFIQLFSQTPKVYVLYVYGFNSGYELQGRRLACYESERDEEQRGGGRSSSRAATAERCIRFPHCIARSATSLVDGGEKERESKICGQADTYIRVHLGTWAFPSRREKRERVAERETAAHRPSRELPSTRTCTSGLKQVGRNRDPARRYGSAYVRTWSCKGKHSVDRILKTFVARETKFVYRSQWRRVNLLSSLPSCFL